MSNPLAVDLYAMRDSQLFEAENEKNISER